MSNPTELPDLDKLEALAKAAQVSILRMGINGRPKDYFALLDAMPPETVLALIALARRAQPEGEAPQAASIDTPEFCDLITELLAAHDEFHPAKSKDAWSKVVAHIDARINAPAATLSPLCGAQHAESGKEVVPSIVITLRQAHRLVDFFGGHDASMTVTPPRPEWGDMPSGLYAFCTEYPEDGSEYLGETEVDDELTRLDERGCAARAALAAQQAAATAPELEAAFDALESYGENGDYVLASDVYDAFVKGSVPSAPGTPEAPADIVLDAQRWRALLGSARIRPPSSTAARKGANQMADTQLLPCPWCGETPDVSTDASFRLTDGVKYGALQCCVVGPEVRTDYKDVPHWRERAIKAWNDRKALASRPAEVDDEELPLPVARIYSQNGYRRASVRPGPGEPLFSAEQFRQGQRDAVAADRARAK